MTNSKTSLPIIAELSPTLLQPITALIFDVDGVMTNGGICYADNGVEFKVYHVRDGTAIHMYHRVGGKTAILSGRQSPVVTRRFTELGVSVIEQGHKDKKIGLDIVLEKLDIAPENCLFVGDDLIDGEPMQRCGVSVAVCDAVDYIKNIADAVTVAPGGQGAVREVVEAVIKAQGRWEAALKHYHLTVD